MEQCLQRAGPGEAGVERRGKNGPCLLLAYAHRQQPLVGLHTALQGLAVLRKG